MQAEKASVEEVSKIERIIEKNYGCKFNFESYDVFINKKNKIFLLTKNLPKIKSDYFGLYFGTLKLNEKIHLSIEGSWMVGKIAKRNLAIVDEKSAFSFIEGLRVLPKETIECEDGNFVLVKFGDYSLGSGIFKNGYVESLVPKERRVITTMKKLG